MEDKTKLTEKKLNALIDQLEGWSIDGLYIQKTFTFTNFKDINTFLPHLAKTIVSQNHHPDFSFDSGSKSIFIKVTTHSEKAITQCDIDLAAALNDWR